MADLQPAVPHCLTLHSREKLTVTAVSEVAAFDENTVVLPTPMGTLIVHGRGLQLKALSPEGGCVTILGSVSALEYQENRPAGGWLRRLLG